MFRSLSSPLDRACVALSPGRAAFRVVKTSAPKQSAAGAAAIVPPSRGDDTSFSLPLPGGNDGVGKRAEQSARVNAELRRLPLPMHGKIDARDVLWVSDDLTLVGVGAGTDYLGFHTALSRGVFQTKKVAAVRDVFGRSKERYTLSDCFSLLADDVAAVARPVVRDATALRLVDEYISVDMEEEPRLVKHDVNLVEYLRSSGFRIIPYDREDHLRQLEKHIPVQQSTNHILACSPTAFDFNPGAAEDNHFMNAVDQLTAEPEVPEDEPSMHPVNVPDQHLLRCRMDDDLLSSTDEGGYVNAIRRKVLDEYAGLYDVLTNRHYGVGACVNLHTHEYWQGTPDALFPNNTFSTHTNLETESSCTVVLYPMKAVSRRNERANFKRLLTSGRYTQVYDMTREENASNPAFLEGTGSLVLDRVNRIAYVALSGRSDVRLARTWGRVMGYAVVPFTAVDDGYRPIYHTNVMMSIGTKVAVVCSESIIDDRERAIVLDTLRQTGHHVVEITQDQVNKFCGNVLELENFYGEQVIVMSTGAYNGFSEEQRDALMEHSSPRLIHSDISTIERIGGGGVRCTIAELF